MLPQRPPTLRREREEALAKAKEEYLQRLEDKDHQPNAQKKEALHMAIQERERREKERLEKKQREKEV